jgi:hypothetical protein
VRGLYRSQGRRRCQCWRSKEHAGDRVGPAVKTFTHVFLRNYGCPLSSPLSYPYKAELRSSCVGEIRLEEIGTDERDIWHFGFEATRQDGVILKLRGAGGRLTAIV